MVTILIARPNQIKQYYAENKKHMFPSTMHEFDAKKLPDLEELLAEKLEPYLLELGR